MIFEILSQSANNNAHHEAFRRSCQNIQAAWGNL